MTICDLIIISLDKKIPIRHLCGKYVFEKYNRNIFLSQKLYKDSFPVLQTLRGFWYRVYPPIKDMYSNTFFDIKFDKDGIPCVRVMDEWITDISFLLTHFLNFEPGLHFCVLVRLNDTENETIHTGYTSEMFIAELLQGSIHYDELYLIG